MFTISPATGLPSDPSRPVRLGLGVAQKSFVHRLALALVWLAVAAGAVVFSEPAPVDILTIGIVVLLPVIGLVAIRPVLVGYLAFWMLAAAGALFASTQSTEIDRSTVHSIVSLYLYVSSFVLAAFVAKRPHAHAKLILDAYLFSALIAALAGIVGYFDLVPGSAELLTRHMRASGTFKDPNVLGPYLVPAAIYALHKALNGRFRTGLLFGTLLLILCFGLLLTFSRGAWLNMAIAGGIYGYLQLVTAPTNRQRLKVVALSLLMAITGLGVIAFALQSEDVARLLEQRAMLAQSYDEGPEGRFGGHERAFRLILEHPLGIGALQFGGRHHAEDVHNVYLSMFLNAGWLGGLVFLAIVLVTAMLGLRHVFRHSSTQGLLMVALASFAGVAIEGLVIDVDHWRHLYLLLALIWGLIAVPGGVRTTTLRSLDLASAGSHRSPRPPRLVGRAILLPARVKPDTALRRLRRRRRSIDANIAALTVFRISTGDDDRRRPRIVRRDLH